jgi:hypothetical protein
VDGRVGYTDHDDRSIINADFSGITSKVSTTWLPLETVRLTAKFARSFESESGLFANGIKTTNIAAELSADISDRLKMQTSAGRFWRDYRFDVQADIPVSARRERIDRIGAKLDFLAARKLALSAEAAYEERDSSTNSYQFDATRFGVSAKLALGAADQN